MEAAIWSKVGTKRLIVTFFQAEVPSTQLFSLGNEHNALLSVRVTQILELGNREF